MSTMRELEEMRQRFSTPESRRMQAEQKAAAAQAETERQRRERAEAVKRADAADAKLKAEQARERERVAREKADRDAEHLKGQYRLRFLAAPGATPEAFEREWPAMLAELRRQQTFEGQSPIEELQQFFRARSSGLGRVP